MLIEIILFVVLLYLISTYFWKPSKMPPGSFGYPLIGTLPSAKISITEHLKGLQQKYGDIFTTKWGSYPIVVVADYKLAKKAFSHPDLQGRIHFNAFKIMTHGENKGIVDSDGEVWSENRRFLLRQLRDLGMGKTQLEQAIQEEAKMLVDHLEKTCLNKPSELDISVNSSVVNVIWLLVAGKRYECDDEEITKQNEVLEETTKILVDPVFFIVDLCPWIAKILPAPVLNKLTSLDIYERNWNRLHEFMSKSIQEHVQTLDPENPRDLLDHFILHRQTDNKGTLTSGDDLDLRSIMLDLFGGGSETTATTLRWFVLHMALNPQIQDKIHRLLDEVVAPDCLPSLTDRDKLHYIDATLLEVMRLSTLAPIGNMHAATADVKFEGYTIPKGTGIIGCTELSHKNPEYWKYPNDLYPEHFLDENGKLDSKKEGFMPFSIGRRQCLGESLARMEIYLFAAAIMQRFKIEPPQGVTLDSEPDPTEVLLRKPKPYKIVLRKRF